MNSMINFEIKEPDEFILPSDIIKAQCDAIKEKSNGHVVAKISEVSYLTISFSDDSDFDFQDSNNQFQYEFFITSIATPNYKFRVLYIKYGIEGYPLRMLIDPGIAKELSSKQLMYCDTEVAFNEKLKNILNTKKVQLVVNSLYAKAKRNDYIAKWNDDELPF